MINQVTTRLFEIICNEPNYYEANWSALYIIRNEPDYYELNVIHPYWAKFYVSNGILVTHCSRVSPIVSYYMKSCVQIKIKGQFCKSENSYEDRRNVQNFNKPVEKEHLQGDWPTLINPYSGMVFWDGQ